VTERPEDLARRTAVAIGDEVESAAARLVDRVEDLSLLVMERIAGAAPRSVALSELHRVVAKLRRLAAPMPRLAGRVVAGTYFGLRMGMELYRVTGHGLPEDAEPPEADVTDREP